MFDVSCEGYLVETCNAKVLPAKKAIVSPLQLGFLVDGTSKHVWHKGL